MDKSYELNEAEYEEGITFKKIGYFVKKAWLRAVIYMAICALLVTAIALPIRAFYHAEPIAQTTVEFIYEGIEKGLAPDGSMLNTENIISVTVLDEAVKAAGLEDTIDNISTLKRQVRVEGVYTDEYVTLAKAAANGDSAAVEKLRNYEMHSTSFNIIVSEPNTLGLTDTQVKLLLNSIVNAYYSDFTKRYSVSNLFATEIFTLSQNQSMEFTEIYDIYKSALTSYQTTLTSYAEEEPNFISTSSNANFTGLISDFVILQSRLDLFNSYILSNNVWLDKATAREALVASQADINNNLEPLKAYIVSLNEQIALIQPNTTTSGDGDNKTITVSYPPQYFEYHTKLDAANREVRDYETKLKNIATRLETLSDTESTPAALLSNAATRLKEVEAEISQKVALANDVINDYYQTQFVANSVRQIRPPVVTYRGLTFNIIVVYLAAVIVGLLIACIVTGVKISKSKSLREKNAATGEAEDKSEAKAETTEADKK